MLTNVQKCLRSGSLTSKACRAVLGSGNQLRQLVATCEQREPAQPRRAGRSVGGGLGGLLDGLGDGLGGLLGLNRLSSELSSGAPSPAPTGTSLYGGPS